MKINTIVLSAFLACGMCACATSGPPRDAPRVYESRSGAEIVVRPPPPKVVAVPSARAGYVWTPGYWRWNGREHVWVDGRWMRERSGSIWVPAHWEERGDKWHFEQGHWD